MTKTDQKPTENRLKTDPPQDSDRSLPLKKRGGSVAEIKVLILVTVELFYLQLTISAFLLTIGAFLFAFLALVLTVGAFLLAAGKCVY